MTVNPSQNNGLHAGLAATRVRNQAARSVLPMDMRKHRRMQGVEEMLSSALRESSTEFDRISHKVGEIPSTPKAEVPNPWASRIMVHPAVWHSVRQALLDRELRQLALIDDLTCLYNRRGFFAAATHQMKLGRRNQQALLLFFCDVDNLKKINDSFGHREGDLSLVRAADALEETFRSSDVLARLSGDEFAALALEISTQTQEAILRRLERNLKKSNAKANESRYQLSLSVGVARYDPKHPISLGELMVQADKAMYEKKRDKVRFVLADQ